MRKRFLILAILLLSVVMTNSASAAFDRRFFINNSILFYDGTTCSDLGGGDKGAVQLAGDDNEQKILNFFMQKGLSLAQASGFIGNMWQESTLRPDIREGGQTVDENYKPENGVGFGLVQWTFTARQQPLVEHIKSLGVPITDLGGQLSFVWEELNGQWLGTLNKLRSTDDPVQAALIIHDEYEISAQSHAQVVSTRGGKAKEVYDKYKDAPALGGAAASSDRQNPGGSPDSEAGRSLGKVYIVGDSITEGATPTYESKLKEAGAAEIKVSASVSSNLDSAGTTGTMKSGIDSIKADKDFIKDADTIIVAHGTNNLSHSRPGDVAIKDAIKNIKDSGANGKIYWIDAAITDKGPSNYQKTVNDVNRAIHSNGSSGYKTISWSKAVDSSYDPASASGSIKHNSEYISSDGIHLTQAGNEKLVSLVIENIKSGGGGSKGNGDNCNEGGKTGGNFNEVLKQYAWSEWKGMTIEARQEYMDAVNDAASKGLYVGGTAHRGIDCGGFVTLLVRDSGYDEGYNYDGKGGNTVSQEAWMKENWEHLGNSGSINPDELQPGDVAINAQHTFIYVGEVDGFESKIASASWDERAPMADTNQQPTEPGYNWYRKK